MLLTRPSSTTPRQLRRIQGGSRTEKVDGAMAEVSKQEEKGVRETWAGLKKRNETLGIDVFWGKRRLVSFQYANSLCMRH